MISRWGQLVNGKNNVKAWPFLLRCCARAGMKMILLSIVFATLTGCVGWVPPLSNEPVNGKALTARDVAFIVPGKTTRAEVVRTLGAGYCESPRIAAMAYPWQMPGGTGFWCFITELNNETQQLRTWETATRWRALFLAFDSHGTVTRKELVRLKSEGTPQEQVEKWAGWVMPKTPVKIHP